MIEVNIDGNNIDSETSYMTNLNSENFIETYGINIKELQLSDVSNSSSNSDYSEEINSDEINDYESQIYKKLTKKKVPLEYYAYLTFCTFR